MLARYRIYRGKRPPGDPLPDGIRQDARHRTRHCLRPERDMVETFLATPAEQKDDAWRAFRERYTAILKKRFAEDRAPFDKLARLATESDVFLGCSCPTKKNPDVSHCHTVLALRFMKDKYPRLRVKFPKSVSA
jgi:uncharacterized protein YeaO (DUF488 family)